METTNSTNEPYTKIKTNLFLKQATLLGKTVGAPSKGPEKQSMDTSQNASRFAEKHDAIQKQIEGILAKSFVIGTATYHQPDNPLAKAIGNSKSPTCRKIRSTADFYAISREDSDLAIAIEIKTNDGKHRNMAVELEPLCRHLADRLCFGDETLYLYADLGNEDREPDFHNPKAIWVESLAKSTTQVHIQSHHSEAERQRYKTLVDRYLPHVEVVITNGRWQDPYALVPHNSDCFGDWIKVISNRIQKETLS